MQIPFKLALISTAVLIMASTITACTTTPTTTTLLDQTRAEYRSARNDPQVNLYAPTELTQSAEALDKANQAANQNESVAKIDQLAYLAKQKVAVAEDIAKQKAAEVVVANAEKQRTQIQLAQRTQEVNDANANASVSNQNALVALNDAQQAQAKSARLEQELKDLNAKKTDRGIVITFGDILFDTNKSNLNASGVGPVQKLAQILNENPQRTVLIGGYTDSTGTPSYNLELSQRRAEAVSDILTAAGIARQRINVRGYGETNPIADNTSAQNRQLNRRVEITLSDANGNITGAQ